MKRRPTALILPLFAALAVMLALPATGSATTIAEKKAEANRLQSQLAVLNTRMEVAVEAYDAATQKLADVRARIADNEKQLAIAKYNLTVARKNLAARAVAIYKQRPTDLLDVVLNTGSYDELITSLDMMSRLSQGDSSVVSSVESLKKDIAHRHAVLVADRKKALALVAQREATKQQVAASLADRKQTLASVKHDIKRMVAAAARAKALAAQRAAAAAMASPAYVPSGGTSSSGAHGNIVAIAQQYLGVPYVWGGASPSGFDCSGLAMYCYAQVGVSLPHNAAMQYASITHVAHGSEQPGDLVFFGYSASSIHHVGIYVGGGSMIDAPYTGTVVRYDSAFGGDYYASGRP
jgi:cell wall-associated NlpC family hydrolase